MPSGRGLASIAEGLTDFLRAVPAISDPVLRATAYGKVRPLLDDPARVRSRPSSPRTKEPTAGSSASNSPAGGRSRSPKSRCLRRERTSPATGKPRSRRPPTTARPRARSTETPMARSASDRRRIRARMNANRGGRSICKTNTRSMPSRSGTGPRENWASGSMDSP